MELNIQGQIQVHDNNFIEQEAGQAQIQDQAQVQDQDINLQVGFIHNTSDGPDPAFLA